MNSSRTPLILIVDDFPQNLQVLGKNLEKANYDIAISNSGEDALKKIETISPDLILLDVTMPGLSGFEVCEILKNNPSTSSIPIIFLTARSDAEDIAEGYSKGASDYIHKPFITAELFAKVKTHIELKTLREQVSHA